MIKITNGESPHTLPRTAFAAVVQGLLIALGLLTLLLLPSLGHGAEPWVRAQAGTGMRTDIDGDKGSLRSETYGLDGGFDPFYFQYRHTNVHWRDTAGSRFSHGEKGWGSLDFARVGARMDGRFETENLGWFADLAVAAGWEEQLRQAFGLIGSGGLSYQFSPELSGRIGVWGMANPGLTRFLPIASLDWNTPEDFGPSLSLGFPETMFRYRVEESLTLRAGATADLGEQTYRLADDSHVYRKGYMTTTGVTAGVYLDVAPVAGLTATAGLVYDMKREYEIRSNSGKHVRTIAVENTPSVQFSLGFRF
jgi:hypothetical protein